MAHAGKELGFGEVGLFRRRSSSLQFAVFLLECPIELLLRCLGLITPGQIPSQFCKASRIAGLIANCREHHFRPECRSVLAYPPSLVRETSLGCCGIQVAPGFSIL